MGDKRRVFQQTQDELQTVRLTPEKQTPFFLRWQRGRDKLCGGIHTVPATGDSCLLLGVAQQVSDLTQGVPVSKEHFMKPQLKVSTFAVHLKRN